MDRCTIVLYGTVLLAACVAATVLENPRQQHLTHRIEDCQLAPDTGRCRAAFRMWYYDINTRQCQEFVYGGCGGNGNRFTSKSSCEAMCVNACQPVRCRMRCPNGFARDGNGCEICQCLQTGSQDQGSSGRQRRAAFFGHRPVRPALRPGCPRLACLRMCPFGYIQDDNGCDTCACQSPPPRRCPLRMCRMKCPFGFEKDENDCEICRCAWQPLANACPEVRCMLACEYGFKVDENGCSKCACDYPTDESRRSPRALDLPVQELELTCPPLLCRRRCEFGFQEDENGCEVCICNPRPEPEVTVCRPITCRRHCEFGFQSDDNGCPICACNNDRPVEVVQAEVESAEPEATSTCKPLTCRRRCQYGFRKDENGCDICKCNKRPDSEVISEETSSDRCLLPAETGPCRARMPRWFYNSETGRCEQFIYGGCRGNANNFHHEGHCKRLCAPKTEES